MIRKICNIFNNNAILKASFFIALITCLIKITGYIEKLLLAYFWGTSHEADSYNAVFAFIISIMVFFREIIEPGFLNVFLKVKTDSGEKESWKVFFTVFWCIFPAAVLISSGLLLFPNLIARTVLPGFTGEKLELVSDLMKISTFACIFLIFSTLTNITLNAYKKFTLAIIGDFVFKLAIILCILALANKIGIYATLYGMVLGAIVKITVHVAALRNKIQGDVFCLKSEHLKRMWILAWPLLIGIIFSQISNLVDTVFASYLQEGSISALSYAKKIVEFPVIVLPYALSIVLFPHFSQLNIDQKIANIRSQLYTAIKWISYIFIPLAIFLFLFSEDIIQIIFQRGAFNANSTFLTAKPLAIYSLGMFAFSIETVLVVAYFAVSDTKTPVFIGIICVIINILITWFLIKYISYLGIAWGLVISKTIKVVVLLYLFNNKLIKNN